MEMILCCVKLSFSISHSVELFSSLLFFRCRFAECMSVVHRPGPARMCAPRKVIRQRFGRTWKWKSGDGKSPPFFRYICCCYCACYLLSLPLSLSRHTSTIHDAESITSHRGNSTYPSESSAERENVSKTNTFFCVTISYVGSLNVID